MSLHCGRPEGGGSSVASTKVVYESGRELRTGVS
jgi:hypothetical protein